MWGILCEGIRMDGIVNQGKLQKINSACLWLVDAQFSHAGAQGAAVESKDFWGSVFATDLPMGLLKYPDNIVTLKDVFQLSDIAGPLIIL